LWKSGFPGGDLDPAQAPFADTRRIPPGPSPGEIFVEPVHDLDELVDRLELAGGVLFQGEFERGVGAGGQEEAQVAGEAVVAPHRLDDDLQDAFTADRLATGDRIIADAVPDRRDDPNAPRLAVGGGAKGVGIRMRRSGLATGRRA